MSAPGFRCYCCGDELGDRFVLVSYSEDPDRAFTMKMEHAALAGETYQLTVSAIPTTHPEKGPR